MVSSLIAKTLPDEFLASSSNAGESPRADAKTLPTSEAGREARWRASASPRPLDAPVIRNEAIAVVMLRGGRRQDQILKTL